MAIGSNYKTEGSNYLRQLEDYQRTPSKVVVKNGGKVTPDPIEHAEQETVSEKIEVWLKDRSKQARSNFLKHNNQAQVVAKSQLGVLDFIGANANVSRPDESGQDKGIAEHGHDLIMGMLDGVDAAVRGAGSIVNGALNLTTGFALDVEGTKADWKRLADVTKTAAQNPELVLQAVAEPYKKSVAEGRPWEAVGRGTSEVVMMLASTKGMDKINKLARANKISQVVSHNLDDAARVVDKIDDGVRSSVALKAGTKFENAADDVAHALSTTDDVADKSARIGVVAKSTKGAEGTAKLQGRSPKKSQKIWAAKNKNRLDVKYRTAKEVNAEFGAGWKPPYKNGTRVTEYTTKKAESFSRVHLNADPRGQWVLKTSAIEGLSPEMIAKKYSLPAIPEYISDVTVPAGTRIRTGRVEVNFGGQQGAKQYQLLSKVTDNCFANTQKLGK